MVQIPFIDHIKGSKSSMYRNYMACRLCTSGEDETQDHLERCNFTKEMRENLDLNLREDKIVLWRKITRALKDIYDNKARFKKKQKKIVEFSTKGLIPVSGKINK